MRSLRDLERADRRRFLETSAGAALAGWLATVVDAAPLGGVAQGAGERVLGLVPFLGEGSFPLERTVGQGLGRRRGLDLATLSPASLVTPSDRFFIRTGCPVRLPDAASWKVRVHGLVETPGEISLEDLRAQAVDQGVHLLECAGNAKAAHFGLMSAARWTGVPLWPLLERARPGKRATQVLVSGFDEHDVQDRGSVPGASWIFALDRLRDTGAFLATEMNGAPLAPDHGYPLRLVAPGWYACAAIKWVSEVVLLDDGAGATEHMREYAGRTHQAFGPGGPPLARDFEPATVDPAAAPVRVEKRLGRDGKVSYRIVGVLWGVPPPRPQDLALDIRMSPRLDFAPVEQIAPGATGPLVLWSHTFRPEAPSRYSIELRITAPGVRTRRLDVGFYAREIEITAD